MDPLSCAASIIAVIDLSSKVVQYISTARGWTKDRKLIREQIQACDDVLQQLRDGEDDEEDLECSLKIKALEAPGGPLGRLWLILQVVNAKLQPKDGRLMGALAWPFKEKEIRKLLDSLQHEKLLLGLALTNQNRHLIQDIKQNSRRNAELLSELLQTVDGLSEDQSTWLANMSNRLGDIQLSQSTLINDMNQLNIRQDNRETEQERTEILKWIDAVDYRPQQSDFLGRRQPDSGQWLIESPEYKTWLGTPGETLFCEGIPGAGKTIMTSAVVDDVLQRFSNSDEIGAAYIYFNFKRQSEQSVDDILRSILAQLMRSRPVPLHVMEIYQNCQKQRQGSKPTIEELKKALQAVAIQYTRVFIFVDALDECQPNSGCRDQFITELLDYQEAVSVNVFATSRPIIDISSRFPGLRQEIRASKGDIIKYLDARMPLLPGFVSRSKSLQDDIKKAILDAIDGMFLLAQLHMDSLIGKRSPKAIKKTLECLRTGSRGYDTAYRGAMGRIQSQVPDQAELAMDALMWITCAMRPLSVVELQHALAIEDESKDLDEENLVDITDIISACCGLVTVEKSSKIIRLIHYTTQEFLTRTQQDWFQDPHSKITASCLTYISFDPFTKGPFTGEFDLGECLYPYSFYSYAAWYWIHHYRKNKSSCAIRERATQFLCNDELVHTSALALFYPDFFPSSRSHYFTGLHMASMFGILEETDMLSTTSTHIDAPTFNHRTPLMLASLNGFSSTIELLLNNGADVNAMMASNLTSLTMVARSGSRQFITTGKEFPGSRREEAVQKLEDEYMASAKLLLRRGASLELGRPLNMAAWSGNLAMVRLLLEAGADADPKTSGSESTPLHSAISQNSSDATCNAIISLLIQKGASVEAREPRGMTALIRAACFGRVMSMQLILENGASTEVREDQGRTAMWCAVVSGSAQQVRLLLEYGANLSIADTQDNRGESALNLVMTKKHPSCQVLRLLRSIEAREIKLDYHDEQQRLSPNDSQEEACKPGNGDFIRKTSKIKSLINYRDASGMTPLCMAVAHEKLDMVSVLLEMESIDLTLSDKTDRDALWWARAKGNATIESLLLRAAEIKGGQKFMDRQVSRAVSTFYQRSAPPTAKFQCDVCYFLRNDDELLFCEVCWGGDFDVCLECHRFGGGCRDQTHEMRLRSSQTQKGGDW